MLESTTDWLQVRRDNHCATPLMSADHIVLKFLKGDYITEMVS